MVKIWKKFYSKGDTVTTFQHNFHWCLSICCTVIRVYLYHSHKIPGPISERGCDTNFPPLCWTLYVLWLKKCYYTVQYSLGSRAVKQCTNNCLRGENKHRQLRRLFGLFVLSHPTCVRSYTSSRPFKKSQTHFRPCWTLIVSSPLTLDDCRWISAVLVFFTIKNLITECCLQSDTCRNGSSIVLVLLTMYTSVSRDKIFTMLPENPAENFPAYRD